MGVPKRKRYAPATPPPLPEPMGLDERKKRLEQRLEDGWNKIGQGELQGRDVRAWEDFWLTLLSEYEAVCRELMGTTP